MAAERNSASMLRREWLSVGPPSYRITVNSTGGCGCRHIHLTISKLSILRARPQFLTSDSTIFVAVAHGCRSRPVVVMSRSFDDVVCVWEGTLGMIWVNPPAFGDGGGEGGGVRCGWRRRRWLGGSGRGWGGSRRAWWRIFERYEGNHGGLCGPIPRNGSVQVTDSK
jgi:hypothetical protein